MLFYCSKCVNMVIRMRIFLGVVMNNTKKRKIRDKKQELTRLADRVYRNTAPLLLAEAALFTIVGLVMMIKPVEVLTAITFIVGAVLVLLGLYRVSMVFVSNQGITAGTFDVFFGLVTFVLGVVFCIFPHGASVGVIYVFVVLFMLNALRMLFFSINMARIGFRHSRADIVVSIVFLLLSVLLIFIPNLAMGILVWLIAIYMLMYAAADIYMFIKLLRLRRTVRAIK